MITINKKLVSFTAYILAGCMLVVLLGFSGSEQLDRKCNGLKIRISDNTGNYFVEPGDIVELLNNRAGKVKQTEMRSVDLSKLERIVYTNPFVRRAEVYATIDGYVNIEIWQRNPVLRVVNYDNEHFYIDDQGEFMPVSSQFTSQVPVASGFIYDKPFKGSLSNPVTLPDGSKPILVQLNELAVFFRGNDFWNAQIEQIYVNELNEIELVPRVGNHTILIGDTGDLTSKMNNLMTFYTEGISKKGWDSYSMINLKYKNQVICTRAK
jgi:cell division protein FtsQ